MDKYIVKKLIAILISSSVFIAIIVAIIVLNKTNEIKVSPPNTEDILPENKGKVTTNPLQEQTYSTNDIYK